jgi:hypothetical protein
MAMIVLTAEVEDTTKWEAAFRTHADLFKKMGVATRYDYAIGENNHVAVCAEANDAKEFLTSLESAENVAAMANDGVKRDTVQVFVVDKNLPL